MNSHPLILLFEETSDWSRMCWQLGNEFGLVSDHFPWAWPDPSSDKTSQTNVKLLTTNSHFSLFNFRFDCLISSRTCLYRASCSWRLEPHTIMSSIIVSTPGKCSKIMWLFCGILQVPTEYHTVDGGNNICLLACWRYTVLNLPHQASTTKSQKTHQAYWTTSLQQTETWSLL